MSAPGCQGQNSDCQKGSERNLGDGLATVEDKTKQNKTNKPKQHGQKNSIMTPHKPSEKGGRIPTCVCFCGCERTAVLKAESLPQLLYL